MTRLNQINRIIGTTAIGLNIIIYIPLTWDIIKTGGGSEGFGLLILPTSLAFHLFIFTGVFAFIDNEKLSRRNYKVTLMTIWFLLCLITLINFGWITTIVVAIVIVTFFGLIGLTVHQKLNVEKSILITNAIGLLGMLVVQLLLNS